MFITGFSFIQTTKYIFVLSTLVVVVAVEKLRIIISSCLFLQKKSKENNTYKRVDCVATKLFWIATYKFKIICNYYWKWKISQLIIKDIGILRFKHHLGIQKQNIWSSIMHLPASTGYCYSVIQFYFYHQRQKSTNK